MSYTSTREAEEGGRGALVPPSRDGSNRRKPTWYWNHHSYATVFSTHDSTSVRKGNSPRERRRVVRLHSPNLRTARFTSRREKRKISTSFPGSYLRKAMEGP